jgi:hypothetical protein
VTAFCYGFDFGPTQTSRSIRGLDRRQVAFGNQRHVTEEDLNEAITTVMNGYGQCELTNRMAVRVETKVLPFFSQNLSLAPVDAG